MSLSDFANKVKPRYDGKGSEFGLLHRKLGRKFGMFDIDNIRATASIELELKEEDVAFFEYRTNFTNSSIEWKALFEVKYKFTPFVAEAMRCKTGTATWAQSKLCELIGARYFFVISNEGIQPFTFYEFVNVDGVLQWEEIGTLDYFGREYDGSDAIQKFWKEKLKL